MDIYQIWTTYNKKWSKYEILAFSVLLLLTVIVVVGCVCRKKINTMQAMAVVMMVIFLGIVFGSTVFTRACLKNILNCLFIINFISDF